MAQHVIVTDYQPEWPRRYQEEAKRIQMILGDNCITIYHIGSTSVPGLAAKPIIDIMPVVKSLEKADEKAAVFERAGYEYLGEFGIRGRGYLRKGKDRLFLPCGRGKDPPRDQLCDAARRGGD